MSHDEFPDLIASLDQTLATMPAIASILHAYYAAMLAVGFTSDQALALTLSYQTNLFTPPAQ